MKCDKGIKNECDIPYKACNKCNPYLFSMIKLAHEDKKEN